jgi:hypothetical protein
MAPEELRDTVQELQDCMNELRRETNGSSDAFRGKIFEDDDDDDGDDDGDDDDDECQVDNDEAAIEVHCR